MAETFGYLINKRVSPFSPCGERVKDDFVLVQDGNNYRLEKNGQIDIQEIIESYEDSVDLKKMIDRFQKGDASALNKKPGIYIDVSGVPTDPRDIIHMTREQLQEFVMHSDALNALSVESQNDLSSSEDVSVVNNDMEVDSNG